MLKYLTVDISQNIVAEANGSNNIVFVNIVEQVFIATLFSKRLYNQCFLNHVSKAETTTKTTDTNIFHWFYNVSKHDVARTIDFTTCLKTMLLKPMVLQHFQNECC